MHGGYWVRWMVGTITAGEYLYLCGIGLRPRMKVGHWVRWMVGTITARDYLCGIGLRPRMKGVSVKSLYAWRLLGKMDGWCNHSQRIPVWDRVKTKNEGSRARATKNGGYCVRWMVGTIKARDYLHGIGLRPRMKGVEPL
jgi:hypothetical protein